MAEVLLLMSLTLAGVSAATIMLTITKLQLIIVNTARLKPKWQNNVNAFFGYLILRTGETKRLLRFIPGAGCGDRTIGPESRQIEQVGASKSAPG